MLAYRARARAQLWRTGPRIFVNSIPKAGTHLLTAELAKFGGLQNSYLHIENQAVRARPVARQDHFELDENLFESYVRQIRGSQYFSSHLHWSPELEEILQNKGVKSIFVVRDPRAILVSRFHYIMNLKRHFLHDFLIPYKAEPEVAYRILIEGHDGDPFIWPLDKLLSGYADWDQSSSTQIIRFEDLVGPSGGGLVEKKRHTIQMIASHIGLAAVDAADIAQSATTVTATLRKGQIDAWQDEMPVAVAKALERACGEQISRLGYQMIHG
jgi:hypothetical protein